MHGNKSGSLRTPRGILLTALSILFLGGCVMEAPNIANYDPLARCYQPYAGQQDKWPTQPDGFIIKTDGIVFYHGLPPEPHVIVGGFAEPDLPPKKLAASAKVHGADAVLLYAKEVTVMKTQHGISIGHHGFSNLHRPPKLARGTSLAPFSSRCLSLSSPRRIPPVTPSSQSPGQVNPSDGKADDTVRKPSQ